MSNYCGADCGACPLCAKCMGCLETCGSPFGGRCVAAEYIKVGGLERYQEFKRKLLEEANELLRQEGAKEADTLYELQGGYVNLAYPLPNGESVKLLRDRDVYLGTQIEVAGLDFCYGIVADASFILLCRYGEEGTDPELLWYKKR